MTRHPKHIRPLVFLLIALATLGLLGLCATVGHAQQLTTPDLSQPLFKNLVGWWHPVAGLTSGDRLFDVGPNRLHATLTNMAYGGGSGWTASERRGGTWHVACDGTNDGLNAGSSNLFDLANTTFTLAAWFKSIGSGVQQFVVQRRASDTGGSGYALRIESANTISARSWGSVGAVATATALSTVTDGLWHHAVGVFTTDTTTSASNINTLYLDGVFQATGSGGGNVYTAPTGIILTMCIDSPLAATFLTGAVDDVLLVNRGLSEAEVRTLYQLSLQGYPGVFSPPDAVVFAPVAGNQGSFFHFMR